MDAFSAAKAKMGAKSGGEAAAAAAVGLAAPQPAAPAPGPAGPGSPCEPAAYKLEDLETLATVGECGRAGGAAAANKGAAQVPACLRPCRRHRSPLPPRGALGAAPGRRGSGCGRWVAGRCLGDTPSPSERRGEPRLQAPVPGCAAAWRWVWGKREAAARICQPQ